RCRCIRSGISSCSPRSSTSRARPRAACGAALADACHQETGGRVGSLGLIFWIGVEVRRLYEEAGIDLAKYHRVSGYFLPVAAKFVVGQDGLIKTRRVSVEFRQRMEPEAVVATLRALKAA